jgi:hypothetical protein
MAKRLRILHRRQRRAARHLYHIQKINRKVDRWIGWYRREGHALVAASAATSPLGVHQYIWLDGHPAPIGNILEDKRFMFVWGWWMESAFKSKSSHRKHFRHCRQVAETYIPGGGRVSTVFLGVDMNHGHYGPPLLFETMVFNDDDWRGFQRRYATIAEARAGHQEVLDQVKHGLVLVEDSEDVDVLYKFIRMFEGAAKPEPNWPDELSDDVSQETNQVRNHPHD